MKTVLVGKNVINLCDYDLYLPIIKNIWIYPKGQSFYSKYKYNPDTGENIIEADPNTWYPSSIKNVILLATSDYELDMQNNKITFYYEGDMHTKHVLMEYETRHCKDCRNCSMDLFDENFCNITGGSKSETSSCDVNEKNVFKYGNVYGKREEKDHSAMEKEILNNQVIAWKSDDHFTEGKVYKCSMPCRNIVYVTDDCGNTVTIDLKNKDFTFTLYPRDSDCYRQMEERLDDLIIKYRKNLTSLYEELDETKEDDVFVKTELLETIISELVMIKNPKKPKLKVGDYVEGYEPYGKEYMIEGYDTYGPKERYIRGTIKAIEYNLDGSIRRCDIQCDDGWNGARGNGLNPRKEINKIERVPEWWKTIDRFNVQKEKEEQEFELYKKKKTFIQLYYCMCPSDIDIFNNRYQEFNLKKDFSPEELYSFVQEAEKNGVLEEMLSYIKSLLKSLFNTKKESEYE